MRKAIRLLAVLVLFLSFAASAEVIPDYYSAPGLDPNRDYLNQHFTEHIDPFSGKLQMHHVDLALPGNGGFDLQFQRSYASGESALGPHTPWGVGWTMHFGRVIKQKDYYVCSRAYLASLTDNPVLELPDGSRQILFDAWGLNSSGPQYITANRWKADCATNGGLIVTSPAGVQYDMTVMETKPVGTTTEYSWYVSRITDRNGNTMNFTYSLSASGYILLKSISASDGRNVSFAYADESTGDVRLSSISSAGQTWSYSYVRVPGYANLWFLTQVTRPDGAAWRYDYYGNLGTSAGSFAMKQVTYPTCGSLSYSYGFIQFDTTNPFNYVTVVKTKSGDGGSWSFNYAPGSSYDLTTVVAPNGTITYKHIGYSASTNGNVWKIGLLLEKKIGSVQTETYSWDGQLISNEPYYRPGAFSQKIDAVTRAPIMTSKVISRDGGTYSTSYSSFDAYGNPQSITENGDASRNRSVTYYINTSKWIVNQLKDETISGVGNITRTFDGSGNMTSENHFGVTTNYAYTSAGDVSTITNARGFSTTFSNYRRGIPQSEQRPAGVSISRTVSDAGNITAETDGAGQTTGYGYDSLNRLTSINRPAGNDVSISWSTNSRSVVRGGFSESTSFDGFGRATSVNAGGISRTMNYNSVGQKTFESYPSSSSGTSFSYDILNRVRTMTNADGSSKSFSYSGSNVNVTNERGNTTSFAYRAYGDPDKKALTAINAPLSSASISMARNGMDQITQVTQGGVTRTYGYDSRFFLTSASNPETGTTSYGRDAVGNMTSKQVGGASAIGYSYDGLNRMTSISYASTPGVTFSYNGNSKVTAVNSSAAQHTYQYNANSNITSETLTVDGYSFTTSYGYDGNDNLSSITYPRSGKTVSYSPNVLGRPTAASPYVTSASYWPRGNCNALTTQMAP